MCSREFGFNDVGLKFRFLFLANYFLSRCKVSLFTFSSLHCWKELCGLKSHLREHILSYSSFQRIMLVPSRAKRLEQRSSVQHLVITSDANPEIMFLFHFLITLGTTLSLYRAHVNIASAVSFYPDTRTMTSSQEPACGGWLARARTLQKASWHPKPGMFSRNTTSL